MLYSLLTLLNSLNIQSNLYSFTDGTFSINGFFLDWYLKDSTLVLLAYDSNSNKHKVAEFDLSFTEHHHIANAISSILNSYQKDSYRESTLML